MAGLILEITTRHEHRYVPLDQPVLRVGRALDNDIILSDPTVSPHHFVIKRDPTGDFVLHSTSDENGIRIGRERLDRPLSLDGGPLSFEAGRTHLRILPTDHPVEPTRRLSCQGGTPCLFGSWPVALGLLSFFLALSVVDNYLATPERLDWESFGRDQTVIVLVVLAISAGLTLLIRLIAHRWEPAPAVSFVSLMLLLATLLDQIAAFTDYFFATAATGFVTELGWVFVIAPFALLWFLIRINHAGTASSLILVLALMAPAAYFQTKQAMNYYGWFGTFSKRAHYPTEIFPVDLRKNESVEIDTYIEDMRTSLANE